MKSSKWNVTTEFEGNMLLFNQVTRNMLIISNKEKERVLKLLHNPNNYEGEKKLLLLQKQGFVMDDSVNEDALLRRRFFLLTKKSWFSHVTLFLTLECNFNCLYCYQKLLFRSMGTPFKTVSFSSEQVDSLCNALRKHLKRTEVRVLFVNYYGGEPLLELSTALRISGALQAICKELNVSYVGYMYTNGYLLSPDVANLLLDVGIKLVVVTIDGNPELHNKLRPLKDGSPTFDQLVSNLKMLPMQMKKVIRVNFSPSTVRYVNELIAFLAKQKIQVQFDFQPFIGTCEPVAEKFEEVPLRYDLSEIPRASSSIWNTLLEFYPDYQFDPLSREKLGPYCDACNSNSLVITPDGKLYKCWGSVPLDNCPVGRLHNGDFIFNHNLQTWTSFDPFQDENCSSCNVLPLCLGGCLFNKVIVNKLKGIPKSPKTTRILTCTLLKYNLLEMMKVSAKIRLRKNGEEQMWL